MNRYLILGLFALLIVVISLMRLLAEQEFFRLTSMKKVWGRRRGLAIHFLSNVGLPLVVGIVYLTHGIVGFSPRSETQPGMHLPRLDLPVVSQVKTTLVRFNVPEPPESETGLCP